MLGALARSREQQQQLVQDAGPRAAHAADQPAHQRRRPAPVRRTSSPMPVNSWSPISTARRRSSPRWSTSWSSWPPIVATTSRRRSVGSAGCASRPPHVSAGAPAATISVVADGSSVSCRPAAIDRAVLNVIDNAAKFSADGTIERRGERTAASRSAIVVRVSRSTICRTSSIASTDRSVSRSQPGSGLGFGDRSRHRRVARGHRVRREPRGWRGHGRLHAPHAPDAAGTCGPTPGTAGLTQCGASRRATEEVGSRRTRE